MSATQLFSNSKRIVIKIGSALITNANTGQLRQKWLATLAEDISWLTTKEIVLVSSGAIALGRNELGIDLKKASKDLKIEEKQAAASIGQIKLLHAYQTIFGRQKINISQILLSPRDTENRRTHLNARGTIQTLLHHQIIPIINENDTVATDEIRFGDNDKLAARVAQMIQADLLFILSTTDGLYTGNPQTNPHARHIPSVEQITEDFVAIAEDVSSGLSTGGMKSKLESAKIATDAGASVIITNGTELHSLSKFRDGAGKSTCFEAKVSPLNARKRWIGAHLNAQGELIIDQGAQEALVSGKSLLPVGVCTVKGHFLRGDAVQIKNNNHQIIATGLVAYDYKDAQKIIGLKSKDIHQALGYAGRDVLVHRDDLALLL